MRLALECPTPLLEMVQPFADFDYILAHKYFEDEAYAAYYKASTSTIKFVDNSVNEVDAPAKLEQLEQIMKEVNGTYLMSPDWIGDYTRTAEAYKECVEKCTLGKERVVGVVQGSSPEEAMKCLELFEGSLVAVPYHVGGGEAGRSDPPTLMALRRALVVSNIPSNRYVHLLGFTTLEELSWYADKPNVISLDTGVPILLGMQCKDYDEFKDKSSPTTTLSEKLDLSKDGWAGICRNIALLRKYMP